MKNLPTHENTLKIVKEFVDKSFNNDSKHFERTLYWVIQLYPDADIALKIAAYSHDIQRAFRSESVLDNVKSSSQGFSDENMLKIHQEEGGVIMYDLLIKNQVSVEIASKVRNLIGIHEAGGNQEADILKDADSISYFECNAEHFITKFAFTMGKEKVKDKLDWMYKRISLEEAKTIAKPFYEKALKDLNEISE